LADEFMLSEMMKERMGLWEVEGCFQLGLIFAGTDLIRRGPSTDQQGDRIDEKRFTGACLPGQDRKPGLELKTKLLDQGEINNAQLGEHCGVWL